MNRTEVLAKVLAEHREAEVATPNGWVVACDCGWDSRRSDEGEPALWAHVAAALNAALAAQEGKQGGAEVAAITLTADERRGIERVEDSGDTQGLTWVVQQILVQHLAPLTALADDLASYNPGHGDFVTAAKRIYAALADPAGALATHDAKVSSAALRAAADLIEPWMFPLDAQRFLRAEARRTEVRR